MLATTVIAAGVMVRGLGALLLIPVIAYLVEIFH
jgi:hypothetical protein